MESRTFLIIWGAVFTIAILTGMYFVGTYLSKQQYEQFITQQNKTSENFNRSLLIHENLYQNITDLKTKLDPVINEIDNVTEFWEDQQIHYNETHELIDIIKGYSNSTERIDREVQDHQLLLGMNKTVTDIINAIK